MADAQDQEDQLKKRQQAKTRASTQVTKNIKAQRSKTLEKKQPTPTPAVAAAKTQAPGVQKKAAGFLGLDKDATSQLLLASLPTLLGAAFGGTRGAAIGAQAAQKGVQTFQVGKAEERQEEKEIAAAAAQKQEGLAKEQRQFKQQVSLKKLDQQIKSTGDLTKQASDLRKTRLGLPITKDTQAVVSAFSKIQAAAAEPSAAGDLSLIFNFMKMLDPGSVVREGEFANAQNSAGVPDRIRNIYNKARIGTRLGTNQRADFVKQSNNILTAQLDNQKRVDKSFIDLSNRRGIDPQDVIIEFPAPPPPAGAQPPTPGGAAEPGVLGRAGQALKPQAQATPAVDTDLSDEDLDREIERLRVKRQQQEALRNRR